VSVHAESSIDETEEHRALARPEAVAPLEHCDGVRLCLWGATHTTHPLVEGDAGR
jgi:hypothetical protein